jgi:hypothetical protein
MSAVTTPAASASTISAVSPLPLTTPAITPVTTTTTPVSSTAAAPTSTFVCDDLSTPDPTTNLCADGSNPSTVTDLGQDTSGLMPGDWDVEAWAPALFARSYYGGRGNTRTYRAKSDRFTVMPFSPAYYGRSGFKVMPFSPTYYADASSSSDPTSAICQYISQDPLSKGVNCANWILVLLLGASAVFLGVSM